ncbi:MAG: hypothetical protein K2Y37_14755 [Pirellulales bacterium]|nr:hypothetical protein [Pirellulales bacterium]
MTHRHLIAAAVAALLASGCQRPAPPPAAVAPVPRPSDTTARVDALAGQIGRLGDQIGWLADNQAAAARAQTALPHNQTDQAAAIVALTERVDQLTGRVDTAEDLLLDARDRIAAKFADLDTRLAAIAAAVDALEARATPHTTPGTGGRKAPQKGRHPCRGALPPSADRN